MIIKWHGYAADSKYCPISKILRYFEEERKNVLVRLDYKDYNSKGWANFEEVDIVIPKIKISNLTFKVNRLDRYNSDNYAIFNCEMLMQKYLLKMFYLLSKLGDPGHSFSLKVDDIEAGWDGDGSDRIVAINGDEKWKEKAFTKYNDGTKSEHIENLSDLITFNKVYKEIEDSYPTENRFKMRDEIREKALEKIAEYEK